MYEIFYATLKNTVVQPKDKFKEEEKTEIDR